LPEAAFAFGLMPDRGFTIPAALALALRLCLFPALAITAVAVWPGIATTESSMSEKEAFEAAKALGTVEAWDAFLSSYPSGFHADLARAYLKKLSGTAGTAPAQGAAPAISAALSQVPAGEFPFAAGSWGGILRDGPGQHFRKVASLKEGEPVTLLERADVSENGFPWFKLRTQKGQTGYPWGGILCAIGTEHSGLFQTYPASTSGE
jgi:SH3 domain-containing protein